MRKSNRREWLRNAGLATGALSLLGLPGAAAASIDFSEYLALQHPPRPGDGQLVKLSSNENPNGPSPFVQEAMRKAFGEVCRYPTADRDVLTRKIAAREGVSPEHVLVTVGSTEALKVTAVTYLLHGGEVVAGTPTFEAMLAYAQAMGAHVHRVPVDDKLGLDLAQMERRCTSSTRLVFLCNPNNPTGTLLPAEQVRDFCQSLSKNTMVFSDEAYYDYITVRGYPSMVELVKQDMNVIVSRTFSKVYGLAGIRIGYIVARPDIIARIRQFQTDRPNTLALHAALAALDEKDFYDYSLEMNTHTRQMIYTTLDELKLPYVPSHGNFVFFHAQRDVQGVMADLRQQGILVGRPFAPLNDWCRVSTGTIQEMKAFQKAMKAVFS